jgi:thiol-disulfide isomerase/thioredoxin
MHLGSRNRLPVADRSAVILKGVLLAAAALALIWPAGAGSTRAWAKEEAAPASGPASGPATGSAFPKEWFYGTPEQRAQQDELVGQPMPLFDLSGWYGNELKTSKVKGKILIVDFWATWCHPCIMAMPHNNEMAEKYKSQGVLFLGVCTTPQGQERMKDVATAQKLNYPQAKDPQSKTESAWRVQWYPTYAVVDRQGKVRGIGLLPQFVEPAIQKLLAEGAKK